MLWKDEKVTEQYQTHAWCLSLCDTSGGSLTHRALPSKETVRGSAWQQSYNTMHLIKGFAAEVAMAIPS